MNVPVAVPSLSHSSRPLTPSSAMNATELPKAVRLWGWDEQAAGLMSLTSVVPTSVPSVSQSSRPLSPRSAEKKTVAPISMKPRGEEPEGRIRSQRIFVDNRIKDAFCDAFADAVSELVTGDPTNADTEVGPLILPREVDRVASWVDEAISAGARVLGGGARLNERLYAPTILVEPPVDASVSTLEIFGPVTCVYGFDDAADAVARANGLPLAFQAAVYTRDIDRALGLANRLDAGAVMVNDHPAFRVDWMPFAGRRTSGYGVGGIEHTISDMSQEKMIVIRTEAH